jgi:hypothetical protein
VRALARYFGGPGLGRDLLLGGAASALFAAGTCWLHVSPPWPEDRTVAGATFLVGLVAYAAAGQLLAPWEERRLRSAGIGVLAALLAVATSYCLLWAFFTYPVSEQGDRVTGSWAYTAETQDYLAMKAEPMSPRELLADVENEPEQVFEKKSLTLVRCALLASWFLTCAGLAFEGALSGLLVARRAGPGDPLTARLKARVDGWPAGVDPQFRAEIQQALRILADANVPMAILNVSVLLEGEQGLLGKVAAAHGQSLQGGNLFAQIEDLAKKGIVPGDIMSDLHWIRRRSNSARHDKGSVTMDDAQMTINRAIHVVEWYHYRFGRGPRLPLPPDADQGPG